MVRNHEKLSAWRKLQGWSQARAAEEFGVTQGTWAPWETGKKAPDRENAPELERFTDGVVKASEWPSRKKTARRTRPALPHRARRTGTDG